MSFDYRRDTLYAGRAKNRNRCNTGPGFIIPSIYGYERIRNAVTLKYGKLATKYPWMYEYFLQCIYLALIR